MRYRQLRIAWSVFCGLAAVLLIVLWARSYWRFDSMRRVADWSTTFVHIEVCSDCGWIGFTVEDALYRLDLQAAEKNRWRYDSFPNGGRPRPAWNAAQDPRFPMPTFRYHVALPHWLLAFLIASFAAVPWIVQLRWRFSLRTMLIATTLIAVVFGLIAWARAR
jgi:hypothetical protein